MIAVRYPNSRNVIGNSFGFYIVGVSLGPSLVAYKTLSSPWSAGPKLSPGVLLTLYPIGEWIATTRFELSFARTPRFWLVAVDAAPSASTGELPLQSGESFFLEWQGTRRDWVRRPRFEGDVQRLGGYSVIPRPQPPRPPTPPGRHDPPRPPSQARRNSTPASASASGAQTPENGAGRDPPPRV